MYEFPVKRFICYSSNSWQYLIRRKMAQGGIHSDYCRNELMCIGQELIYIMNPYIPVVL